MTRAPRRRRESTRRTLSILESPDRAEQWPGRGDRQHGRALLHTKSGQQQKADAQTSTHGARRVGQIQRARMKANRMLCALNDGIGQRKAETHEQRRTATSKRIGVALNQSSPSRPTGPASIASLASIVAASAPARPSNANATKSA